MKNLTKFIPILLLLLFSCKIEGDFNGLFGYYNQTLSKYPKLINNNFNPTCDFTKKGSARVIAINGIDLKNCIYKIDKVLIYIWSPNCTSESCYSIEAVQNKCNELNIELFIVAEYYDFQKMNNDYKIKNSIIGIDTKYYKTFFTSKYLSRFTHDLIGKDYDYKRFLEFKNGLYTRSFDKLENITTMN